MMDLLIVVALIAVGLLGWTLYRHFGADRIAELNEKRRSTSRMVGVGEFVDGSRHLKVALAVTQSEFFYENSDTSGALDLQWIREIEYDNELATGRVVAGGKVLRLRSQSQTFEFVIPGDSVARWHMMLPPRKAADTSAPLILPRTVAAT